ncbi:hypothetical protein C0991_012170 [Blastosporella zonata]|nr:hypothetical protein C0991_012170 [Blastosporella zonata]
MLDLSEESKEDNIATCVKYFKRMAAIGLWLEMEIGITGGEKDGVDNTGVDRQSNFSIAAAFGKSTLEMSSCSLSLLSKYQSYASQQLNGNTVPRLPRWIWLDQGGDRSVGHGVVKMNVDTYAQFAYLPGIRDFVENKKEAQFGNPEGADRPNKKHLLF